MKKLLVALTLSLVACGRGVEADGADDADESVSVTSSESALTSELADEVTQPVSVTSEQIAQAAATRVGSHLTPQGCLTTTVTGATVTYVFNNCTGPYGLVTLTGTVNAVYSRAAGGQIQVVLTGNGLKANKVTFDLNATVKASQAQGVRKAEVVANSSGTGPRGQSVSRNGQYTATYDFATECITIDGTWETKSGLRTATTVVTGFKWCKGGCPSSGGSIVWTQGKTVVTVTYDGSAVAKWATAAGRSGTVNLKCGG